MPRRANTFNAIRRTLFGTWINVLLVAALAGIVIWALKVPGPAVFIVNFIAIIPLAAMLSYATEQIALRTGDVVGGLINATFGDAVELIVTIIALTENCVTVVQTSLVGSVLSNLLLVLGFCFALGGINRPEQRFSKTLARTALVTHRAVLSEESKKVTVRDIFDRQPHIPEHGATSGTVGTTDNDLHDETGQTSEHDRSMDTEEPDLHFLVALGTLILCTVIIALCAEGLVSGIEPISSVVSEEFIGLILIPIVGNACEHATAVTVAVKDKMDLAIGIAIRSSLQVSLFLVPLLIIIGWGIGIQGMTLAFETFQVVVLFLAVLLTHYLISDGTSHWVKGAQLVSLYVIIAVCAFYYPNNQNAATGNGSTMLQLSKITKDRNIDNDYKKGG
ncbi:Sodium/calcium exchanger protein-domain-containing protein [Xylaria sp. FL0064]|nr:Sodium/calcium exchanger protein-domain-containing protein [Xylaria sp. FL0064]